MTEQKRTEMSRDEKEQLNRVARAAGRQRLRVVGHHDGGYSLTTIGSGPRGRPAAGRGAYTLDELAAVVSGPPATD